MRQFKLFPAVFSNSTKVSGGKNGFVIWITINGVEYQVEFVPKRQAERFKGVPFSHFGFLQFPDNVRVTSKRIILLGKGEGEQYLAVALNELPIFMTGLRATA